ncbi:uncharacterized protein LOC123546395 [Mercenaria mercenaria]|uniref:uncharacterized protein LOC123546395 n=1 Tax=Mercenaria mercenaria TaxID=6596 RepID=UPI00234F52E0|nr:uncharacterized protein LOC123546395 [Mercenaria mercenaria]
MSNRKRSNMQQARPQLPPIINEDDGELPFFKQDFFSDVALIVSTDEPTDHHGARKTKNVISGKKLYTARCILAYNSPVFEKMMGNAKKHEIDLSNKNFDDIVELMCFLDPRVPYTVTAQTAKQLLPLAEEYEMFKLRRNCANVLHTAYEQLRKEYRLGHMPSEINEEYLILADRYHFDPMLLMCVDEFVHYPEQDMTKSFVNSETVSEGVKLMILERKLARLNNALEKERRYKTNVESKLDTMSQKKKWTNKFDFY